ncbi:Hypothetical_protein [Hexamita inflata]|uniref:Hypothetical_protein n=1 Tax=Hexamita inflata TaxID=28002 RepID=A0AA86NR23_9EUKA|nr:Hypothetical protein HINF_LOCUS11496 [Hexamita inflata]
MNIQVLTGPLEVSETELTCLFTGLYRQSSSGSHLFPRTRIHDHWSDKCDYTSNCWYFVQLLCLRVSQQHWLKLARLQRSSARSTPYFPFPFSLVQAVPQSLSAGVGRLHLQEVV